MKLDEAARLMSVRDARGWDFHYSICGIYHQGLFTVAKAKDDPTRACTCGMDEAVDVLRQSPSVRRALA